MIKSAGLVCMGWLVGLSLADLVVLSRTPCLTTLRVLLLALSGSRLVLWLVLWLFAWLPCLVAMPVLPVGSLATRASLRHLLLVLCHTLVMPLSLDSTVMGLVFT